MRHYDGVELSYMKHKVTAADETRFEETDTVTTIGSGATATCTVYNGSKCYIPFTDDNNLSTVLVVGSDAADLTNPTFV